MSIRVTCSCGQELRVKDAFAGRRMKCPGCGEPLRVPRTQASGAGASRPHRAGRSRRSARGAGTHGQRRTLWPWIAGALGLAAVVGIGAYALRPKDGGGSSRTRGRGAAGSAVPGIDRHVSDADVAALVDRLSAKTIRARTAAAQRLARLGPRAKEAVPALLAGLMRPSPGIEFTTAVKKALRAIGEAAVPDLLAALESPDSRTRFYAARALGHLGKHGASAVPALTETLRTDADYSVRASAATALGQIGPPARNALPALRKAVGNTNTAFSGQPDRDALRAAAQVAIRNILHPPRARDDDDLGGRL